MRLCFESTGRETKIYGRVLSSYSDKTGINQSDIEIPNEPAYIAKISKFYPHGLKESLSETNGYLSGYFDAAHDGTLRLIEEGLDVDLGMTCSCALYMGRAFPHCFAESCKDEREGLAGRFRQLPFVERMAFVYILKKSPLHPLIWKDIHKITVEEGFRGLAEILFFPEPPNHEDIAVPENLLKSKVETAISNRPRKVDFYKLVGNYFRPPFEDDEL